MNKLILLFLIGAGSGGVMADSSREQTIYNTYNNYLSETTVNQNSDCKEKALSAAQSNNQMAYGVHRPQMSIGGGYCNGDSAVSVMFGGRLCDKCSFINGNLGYDGEDAVVGAGVLILF